MSASSVTSRAPAGAGNTFAVHWPNPSFTASTNPAATLGRPGVALGNIVGLTTHGAPATGWDDETGAATSGRYGQRLTGGAADACILLMGWHHYPQEQRPHSRYVDPFGWHRQYAVMRYSTRAAAVTPSTSPLGMLIISGTYSSIPGGAGFLGVRPMAAPSGGRTHATWGYQIKQSSGVAADAPVLFSNSVIDEDFDELFYNLYEFLWEPATVTSDFAVHFLINGRLIHSFGPADIPPMTANAVGNVQEGYQLGIGSGFGSGVLNARVARAGLIWGPTQESVSLT